MCALDGAICGNMFVRLGFRDGRKSAADGFIFVWDGGDIRGAGGQSGQSE